MNRKTNCKQVPLKVVEGEAWKKSLDVPICGLCIKIFSLSFQPWKLCMSPTASFCTATAFGLNSTFVKKSLLFQYNG